MKDIKDDKFKTNPFAKKYKAKNMALHAKLKESKNMENGRKIKTHERM